MQSAYQAARWQQQQEVKDTHPYLQYLAVMDSHTRPGHAAMHGRVFALDNLIWNTCYPPNGFNCRCTVRALSKSALKREGLEVEKAELDTVTLKAGKDKTAKVTSVKLKDKAGKPVVFHPDVGFNANMGKDWHREFTPPSEDGSPNAFPLIRTFERGVRQGLKDMDIHRTGYELLPKERSEIYYARKFLKSFGGDIDKPVIFLDKMGYPLEISLDLFKESAAGGLKSDEWKITKMSREKYLLQLAETIRYPDEIWLEWRETSDGKYFLRRRYIRKVDVGGGKQIAGIAIFEKTEVGKWRGITAFRQALTKKQQDKAKMPKTM